MSKLKQRLSLKLAVQRQSTVNKVFYLGAWAPKLSVLISLLLLGQINKSSQLRSAADPVLLLYISPCSGTWILPLSWTLKGSCAKQPSVTTTRCAKSERWGRGVTVVTPVEDHPLRSAEPL